MSKFISSPAKMVGRGRSRAFPARGSLTTASRSGGRPQCLDLGANIRLDRGVVRALQDLLVGLDRGGQVLELLRRPREREQVVLGGVELRELLVGRQRRLGRALVLGIGLLRGRAAAALKDARDRVVA